MSEVIDQFECCDGVKDVSVALTGRFATSTKGRLLELIARAGGRVPERPGQLPRGIDVLVVGMRGYPLDIAARRRLGLRSRKIAAVQRRQERGEPVQIVPETVLRQWLGLEGDGIEVRKRFGLEDAARSAGLDADFVQHCVLTGLVHGDADGRIDFADLTSLRDLAALVQSGVPVSRLRRSLEQLRGCVPASERAFLHLEALDAAGEELVGRVASGRIARNGQYLLFGGERVGETAPEPLSLAGAMRAAEGDDPRSLFKRAIACEDAGRDEEAAELYRRVVGLRPGKAAPLINLGNVLKRLGDWGGAEQMYRLAVAVDGKNVLALNNLGRLLHQRARVADAASLFERVLEIAPHTADALWNLADCFRAQHRHEEARRAFERYLRLDPDSAFAASARTYLASGRLEEVVRNWPAG